VTCPACREAARFVGYRRTKLVSLFGSVVYERAYYHCPHCHQGEFPTDSQLHLQQGKTLAASEIITLAGLLEPFEESADRVLCKMTGLRLSTSTVRRVTEQTGDDLARRRTNLEVIGPQQPWTWHRDTQGRSVAYSSLDATGVRQQGPCGEQAEGRMSQVAAIFNPALKPLKKKSQARLEQVRYLSGLLSLPEIGRQLRRECRNAGMDQADVVVALTDGGGGLEDCLLDALGGVAREIVFVLDFYHASEHIHDFLKDWIPDESRRKPIAAEWCHLLKEQGGAAILDRLQELDLSQTSAAIREAHRLLSGYLERNRHRTDDPTYLRCGWQIGSGVIESACKSVVGRRLKGPGMRWRERGTTALCQLRALYLSESSLWDHYWTKTLAT